MPEFKLDKSQTALATAQDHLAIYRRRRMYHQLTKASSRYRRQSLGRPVLTTELALTSPTAESKRVRKTRKSKLEKSIESVDAIPEKPSDELARINALLEPTHAFIHVELRKWTRMAINIVQHSFYLGDISTPIPLNSKTNTTRADLEQDGFYIGALPNLPRQNMYRLTRRLGFTEPTRPWFLSPYELDILPDPLTYIHQKPSNWLKETSNERAFSLENLTERQITQQEELYIVAPPRKLLKPFTECQLVIDINSIQFRSHYLMNSEQTQALVLEQLVDSWHERARKNAAVYLDARVETLCQAYFGLLSANSAQSAVPVLVVSSENDQLETYRVTQQQLKSDLLLFENEAKQIRILKEITAARLLRDTEAHTDKALEFKIVKIWDELKQSRIEAKCCSTNIKLLIRAKKVKTQKYDLKDELEKELAMGEALYNLETKRLKRVHAKLHSDWKLRRQEYKARFIHHVQNIDGENDSTEPKEKLDEGLYPYDPEPVMQRRPGYLAKKQKDEIKKRLQGAIRLAGSPILYFTLEHNQPITETFNCTMQEQARRRQVECLKYVLTIKFNDKIVTRTHAKPLNADKFSIHFSGLKDLDLVDPSVLPEGFSDARTAFGITVNEAPSNISVQIDETVFVDNLGSLWYDKYRSSVYSHSCQYRPRHVT